MKKVENVQVFPYSTYVGIKTRQDSPNVETSGYQIVINYADGSEMTIGENSDMGLELSVRYAEDMANALGVPCRTWKSEETDKKDVAVEPAKPKWILVQLDKDDEPSLSGKQIRLVKVEGQLEIQIGNGDLFSKLHPVCCEDHAMPVLDFLETTLGKEFVSSDILGKKEKESDKVNTEEEADQLLNGMKSFFSIFTNVPEAEPRSDIYRSKAYDRVLKLAGATRDTFKAKGEEPLDPSLEILKMLGGGILMSAIPFTTKELLQRVREIREEQQQQRAIDVAGKFTKFLEKLHGGKGIFVPMDLLADEMFAALASQYLKGPSEFNIDLIDVVMPVRAMFANVQVVSLTMLKDIHFTEKLFNNMVNRQRSGMYGELTNLLTGIVKLIMHEYYYMRSMDIFPIAGRKYTIKPGDSLSGLAITVYGNADLWTTIYNANLDVISNPDRIFPGQVIYIPRFIGDSKENAGI